MIDKKHVKLNMETEKGRQYAHILSTTSMVAFLDSAPIFPGSMGATSPCSRDPPLVPDKTEWVPDDRLRFRYVEGESTLGSTSRRISSMMLSGREDSANLVLTDTGEQSYQGDINQESNWETHIGLTTSIHMPVRVRVTLYPLVNRRSRLICSVE